jgi:hypothetical protein
MSREKTGPEAKIIALFTALPDTSKAIVMDILKSQTATPRKPTTRKLKNEKPERSKTSILPDDPDQFQHGVAV